MYRKAFSALIQNNDKYLIVHKIGAKENIWYVPSGGVEDKETMKETIYRELFEELGLLEDNIIIISKSPITHKFEWDEETTRKKGFIGQEQEIFFIKLKNYELFDLSISEELDDYKWVSEKELFTEIPYKDFLKTLALVFKERK